MDYPSLSSKNPIATLNNAFEVAEKQLGIPRLLDPEGIIYNKFLCIHFVPKIWWSHTLMRNQSWRIWSHIITTSQNLKQRKREEGDWIKYVAIIVAFDVLAMQNIIFYVHTDNRHIGWDWQVERRILEPDKRSVEVDWRHHCKTQWQEIPKYTWRNAPTDDCI